MEAGVKPTSRREGGTLQSQHPPRITLDDSAKFETFRKSKLFRELRPEVVRELAALSSAVRFEKGDTLFSDGDPAEFFYLVHSGLVKLYKGAPSGKNLTITVSTRGETLNGLALSLDEYFMTAQAMGDLVVLRIARKEFLSFVNRNPEIALQMVVVLAKRLNRDYVRLVDVIGERIETRIAHSLCVLAQKFGTKLSLTREELADFAGTTTETTIRVLSKLKREGIISTSPTRGEIIIADLEKLEDFEAF